MAKKITSPTCIPPELHEMVNKLQSISSSYYELGIQLKVKTNDLKAIEKSNTNHYRKLIDMLDCWSKSKETHSWDEICEALRNIGEIKLAKQIQADTQSRPRRCAIAKLPYPPPAEDTTVTEDLSAREKHEQLRRLYSHLLTNFMEYLEELDITKVKCILQDTLHLGCEDYPSEKILKRMKSSMNLYNIAPIQYLVEVFPNEDMSDNVEAYCKWKEQFLQSTPIRELQYLFVQGSTSLDEYEVKLKVQSSLVCDRENKLKVMDDLVRRAFGPFYNNMTEMEHPHHSAETFCWRMPKLIGVEAIAHVQRYLDSLNEQGVEEVTVGNFQLMPSYCQGYSTRPPLIRSMSLTPTEDYAHLKLQNHTLQTELRRLRREKEDLQREMQNFQSQIEDLDSQLRKARQKRKADEATEDDDTKPSSCQQKCAKLEKKMEKYDKLYNMLQVSTQVIRMREINPENRFKFDTLSP